MPRSTPHPSAWEQVDLTDLGSVDVVRLATEPLYGSTPLTWLLALAAAAAAYFALRLFFLLARRLAARRKKGGWLGFLLSTLTHTHRIPAVLVSLYFASIVLSLPQAMDVPLRLAALAGLLGQIGLWATGAVEGWATRTRARYMTRNPAAVTTLEIGRIALHGFIWFALTLVLLDNAGFDITTLVAGLGIGGIAIALAVQNLLGDFLASVSIAADRPFVVGDFLVVGTEKGTVEHIGLKTTRLRSISGEQIVLSNADLLASRIQNHGRMYERRVQVVLGVTYDTPRAKLEAIPELLRAAVGTQAPKVRFDRAHFTTYGSFSLNFEYVYYVTSADFLMYRDVQQAINLAIHAAFEKEGVAFAFPTQTLYVRREVEA